MKNFLCASLVILINLANVQQVWAGKKRCQEFRLELLNIQSQQKAGYTLKQGERLLKKENKARKKWWDCEKGKLSTSTKKTKTPSQSSKAINQKQKNKGKAYMASTKNVSPFQTNQSIHIKTRYEGKLKQQWLAFYQQPKQCIKPEDYRVFVWCIEHKSAQSKAFEMSLYKKDL